MISDKVGKDTILGDMSQTVFRGDIDTCNIIIHVTVCLCGVSGVDEVN